MYPPYDTHRLGHRSKTAELALRGSFATPRSAGETTRSDSSGQRDTPSLGTRWRPQPCQQAHAAATQWARDECGSSISRHKARSGGFGTSARMNSRPCPPARSAGKRNLQATLQLPLPQQAARSIPYPKPDIANDQLDSSSLPHLTSTRQASPPPSQDKVTERINQQGLARPDRASRTRISSTSSDHRTRQVHQEVFWTWHYITGPSAREHPNRAYAARTAQDERPDSHLVIAACRTRASAGLSAELPPGWAWALPDWLTHTGGPRSLDNRWWSGPGPGSRTPPLCQHSSEDSGTRKGSSTDLQPCQDAERSRG